MQSGTAPSHLLPAAPWKYATVLLVLIVTFRLLNGSTLHQPACPIRRSRRSCSATPEKSSAWSFGDAERHAAQGGHRQRETQQKRQQGFRKRKRFQRLRGWSDDRLPPPTAIGDSCFDGYIFRQKIHRHSRRRHHVGQSKGRPQTT